MPARRPDAQLVAVLAARGNGKSAWVKQYLAKARPSRLAVWDTKREHGLQATNDLAEFVRWLKGRAWQVAFHPTIGDPKRLELEFDLFCRALYVARRCTGLVEELAFVTRPSWAPPAWRTLLLLGREEQPEGGNVSIIATAQRPASVDKDLLGNATLIHAGRLPYEDDARLVARALGVPATELQQLPKLHWIERGEHDQAPRRGVVSFTSGGVSKGRAARSLRPVPKAEKLPDDE